MAKKSTTKTVRQLLEHNGVDLKHAESVIIAGPNTLDDPAEVEVLVVRLPGDPGATYRYPAS